MTTASGRPAAAAAPAHLAGRDIAGLLFVADMYGVQPDQLAAVLGVGESRARGITASWRRARYAESARLGPGGPWTWLTRPGLAACGLPFPATIPALSRLAHLRAVTAVRLALEATSGYRAAGAFWRSERRLRARVGGRVGLREHIPDGEVHWPDGTQAGWAGECWAVEAELTRDPHPDGRHHPGDPHARRGLRPPRGAGPGARRAAASCAGAVCLLARRPAGRGPGPGRDRRARGTRGDP